MQAVGRFLEHGTALQLRAATAADEAKLTGFMHYLWGFRKVEGQRSAPKVGQITVGPRKGYIALPPHVIHLEQRPHAREGLHVFFTGS